MGNLGKYMKGKANRPTQKATVVRVKNLDKSVDDLEREAKILKDRKTYLKTAMIEEQKMAHFNRMKILTHWRKLLRLAKTEQLKKEIQIYQQNHDREVDAKDAIMQMLDRDLDEAEEQYQMALRNHLIHVDELIELQGSRLMGLKKEFQRDVDIITEEYNTEKKEIEHSHYEETRELDDMIETIREEEQAKLEKMKADFDGNTVETKNKNVEDLDQMRNQLTKKIDDYDTSFEQRFQHYLQETSQDAEKYKDMLKQNEVLQEFITQQTRRINRTVEQTKFFELKIKQSGHDSRLRNKNLEREKNKIMTQFHDLKRRMARSHAKQEQRLGDLTTNSKMCMDKLCDYQRLGEKILKTAELCRKLETEKEKVLPFYQSEQDLGPDEMPEIPVEKIEGIGMNTYNEFQLLDNFYRRHNKVLLDKLAIEKQKATLEKENMFFKSLLKQYLDGVSVNDDVLNNNNPLLVVNSRVNLNRPPVERMDGGQPHRTFVEGNVVMNNMAMQRNANYN